MMLADADTHESAILGKITGPEPDESILSVVEFVEDHLIDFSKKYADSNIRNEIGLTQQLVILLNIYATKEKYPFWFHPDYMEIPERGDSPRVDIGTISKEEEGVVIESKTYASKSFFSLEAKRLGELGSKRSKEYLIGRREKGKYINTGGVERFKQGIHGGSLKYGAIIGYVQTFDFVCWHDRIDSWIDDLIEKKLHSPVSWSPDDKLIRENIKSKTARFVSKNSRRNDYITLFHLWTTLNRDVQEKSK